MNKKKLVGWLEEQLFASYCYGIQRANGEPFEVWNNWKNRIIKSKEGVECE